MGVGGLRTYVSFTRIGDQPYGRIRINANFVAENAPKNLWHCASGDES
jgi:hypothetical protein